jgi:hypothetical protein
MGQQSTANNQGPEGVTSSFTWKALNQILAKEQEPTLGVTDYDSYTAFAKRWETDPELKRLVDKFNGDGLVLKTAEHSPEVGQEPEDQSELDRTADRANKKFK